MESDSERGSNLGARRLLIPEMSAAIVTSVPFRDARTERVLAAPILPLLLRLGWPNLIVMIAQSATGLVELYFLARMGTFALTAMALVTPNLILMQNMSQGAVGGGISSAIARALGSGDRDGANRTAFHAVLICLALGSACGVATICCGRWIYATLGATGEALDAAVLYSSIVFAGMPFLWLFNGLANVIRGSSNMIVPGMVICVVAIALMPLSAALIFGIGSFSGWGVAGGGLALVLYYVAGSAVLLAYILTGRSSVRLAPTLPSLSMTWDILSVGAAGAVNVVQATISMAGITALVAAIGPDIAAGFGAASRLEILIPPLAFGLGAPMVALVGTNIGAGQPDRALKIALVGGCLAFLLTEAVGLTAAFLPTVWLHLFGEDPDVVSAGTTYLHYTAPVFGIYGAGLALYFASQGARRLKWPLVAGFMRMSIVLGGGWLALRLTGSLHWLFAVYACGLAVYGLVIVAAVASGSWFTKRV